jgi:hypothetical protein
MLFSYPPYVPHAVPITFFDLILSAELYFVRSTNLEASHYDISYSLLLPFLSLLLINSFKPLPLPPGSGLFLKSMFVFCHWVEECYCPDFPKMY